MHFTTQSWDVFGSHPPRSPPPGTFSVTTLQNVALGVDHINIRAGIVDDVAVTRQNGRRLGFTRIVADDVADIAVMVEGFVIAFVIEGCGFCARIRRANQYFRRVQLVAHGAEVHPDVRVWFSICIAKIWYCLLRSSFSVGNVHWKVIVIHGKHSEGESDLFEVADALDFLCFGFGFGQGGKEHPGENGDDGDNDQQLDEREGPVFLVTNKLSHVDR